MRKLFALVFVLSTVSAVTYAQGLSQSEIDALFNRTASKIEAGTTIPDAVEIILMKTSDSSCLAPSKGLILIPTDHSKPTVGGCWTSDGSSITVHPMDSHPSISLPVSMFHNDPNSIGTFAFDILDAARRAGRTMNGNAGD